MTAAPRRLVVGIPGSSAPQLGIRLLEVLQAEASIETHLVISAGSRRSIELEAGVEPDHVTKLATSRTSREIWRPGCRRARSSPAAWS